ncbi:RNA polymerase sigma factor [Paraliomyxa miuraensis]|uniref:RNA polymerase sigma factor n=1 Tax=Paraliomyxa miuraensis TaxID=376150 RepID=UPI002252F241|nr:RNA polymerase sigma factor [Paraliomyxa miuraensis]
MPASAAASPSASSSRPTLAALYRAHAGFVWRAVRRMGIPDAAAEDVVQEVFLVARRRLPDYEGRGAPTSWLYAIARGVTANYRRGQARAERRLRVVSGPRPAAVPSPEDEVGRADAVALVERFLADLDPDQREVFVLVDIEGQSGPEVAHALELNLNVAYSRLRLARQKFRRFVAEHSPVQEPS